MCSTAWKCTELPEETFFPLNEQLKAHFPLQCVFVRGQAHWYYSNRLNRKRNEKQPLGERQQKEEEHLCALMLMMSEYMEKRANEGTEVRGWSCWQALNVQLPHISLHHTLYPHILSAHRM